MRSERTGSSVCLDAPAQNTASVMLSGRRDEEPRAMAQGPQTYTFFRDLVDFLE